MTPVEPTASILRTTPPFLRMTTGMSSMTHAWVGLHRTAAFVRALRQRHQAETAVIPHLNRIFLRPRPPLSLTYHQARVHLAPRLTLTVLRSPSPTTPAPPILQVSTRGRRVAPVPVSQRLTAPTPARSHSEVLSPTYAPVPLVFHKPNVVLAEEGLPFAAGTSHRRSSVPAPLPMVADTGTPPIDVQNLADEVIQTIDRRIVAQRERLGRI